MDTLRGIAASLPATQKQASHSGFKTLLGIVIALNVIGFSLWVLACLLSLLLHVAFNGVPFTLMLVGAGFIGVAYIFMFASLIHDEIEFRKIMNKR